MSPGSDEDVERGAGRVARAWERPPPDAPRPTRHDPRSREKRAGCRTYLERLEPARAMLAAQHVPLAKWLVAKAIRAHPDSPCRDEVFSAALLGLTEAASRFRAGPGRKFVTTACFYIRWRIQDVFREQVKKGFYGRHAEAPREYSLPRRARDIDYLLEQLRPHRDRLDGAASDAIAQADDAEHFDALMDLLAPRPRRICTLVYQHGLNLSEVARVLGLSPATVNQAHTQALEILLCALDESAYERGVRPPKRPSRRHAR